MIGNNLSSDAMEMTFRVPNIGIRKVCNIRKVPPASPGIAASQKSCILLYWNPILGSLTTTALIKNHVANDSARAIVVTISVCQAILFPVSFQNLGSSGSHFASHSVILYLSV